MKNPSEEHTRISLRMLRVLLKHVGKSNALSGKQLSEMFGVDTRAIADMAGMLTQEGFWVCSGMGYWYAENKEQWNHQLNKEQNRGIEILKKVHNAKKNSVDEPSLFEVAA
ncbi:MAG: hypothetical protein WC375_10590 [Methanomassiliicoccales archaeon]|jgi:biotin operon repressor